MDSKLSGFYLKYRVLKLDGTAIEPNAQYFVLRVDEDPHAKYALYHYSKSIRAYNSVLADDLIRWLNDLGLNLAQLEPSVEPAASVAPTLPNTERPRTLQGTTHKINTSQGTVYITVTFRDGKPVEVFCNLSKSGTSPSAWAQAVGRLVSLTLRCGIPVDAVVRQLSNISDETVWDNGIPIKSVPDGIARVLSTYSNGIQRASTTPSRVPLPSAVQGGASCPECGGTLEFKEGCSVCRDCGFNKCE